jgi:hypothetical protein
MIKVIYTFIVHVHPFIGVLNTCNNYKVTCRWEIYIYIYVYEGTGNLKLCFVTQYASNIISA